MSGGLIVVDVIPSQGKVSIELWQPSMSNLGFRVYRVGVDRVEGVWGFGVEPPRHLALKRALDTQQFLKLH